VFFGEDFLMLPPPVVFVVDDDGAVRSAVNRLLKTAGLCCETYSSARNFLDNYDPAQPGCIVLDVRMPGLSGLHLQALLIERKISTPVIIMTGFADVPMAVRAMRMGAVNFIEKPFDPEILLNTVKQAIARDADQRRNQARRNAVRERISRLTPREREVMDMIIEGKPNKAIAADLGLSQKTVEFHRKHIMQKTGAESVAELVRLVTNYQEKSN
jgi:RNA polymerase sigma factor (sigma-70 family)